MKKFIYKVTTFLLIPILMIFIFDIWLRQQNSLYKEKFQGLIKTKDNIEILILGNSHATYGVDPDKFNDKYAYNLANVSQTLYFDKRLTLKALEHEFKKLKHVLISFDFHSLNRSSQGELRNIWSYYGNSIRYKDNSYLLPAVSPFLWGYTPKVSLSLVKKAILRKLRYKNKEVLDFDVEIGVPLDNPVVKGFISFNGTNEKVFTERDYQSRAERFKNDSLNSTEREAILQDLDDFIALLLKKGIKPILFSTPTFSLYNKFLDSMIIKKNKHDIEKLLKKYPIEYWNFSDDQRFAKSDFFNCDHLNRKGAAKFAQILAARIKQGS